VFETDTDCNILQHKLNAIYYTPGNIAILRRSKIPQNLPQSAKIQLRKFLAKNTRFRQLNATSQLLLILEAVSC